MAEKKDKPGQSVIASNRKARHDYFLSDAVEAGIALTGTEVKSCRLGNVNLRDSYVVIENDEAFLVDAHINPYEQGNRFNHEPLRKRRLLLHRAEIRRLAARVNERGFTLIPTRMYWSKGRVKLEVALAKGKHAYDKRHSIRERDEVRQAERDLRDR